MTRLRGSASAWPPSRVADHIGMSVQFVRREIACGALAAVKICGQYRIPVSEVQRYCRSLGWPEPIVIRSNQE